MLAGTYVQSKIRIIDLVVIWIKGYIMLISEITFLSVLLENLEYRNSASQSFIICAIMCITCKMFPNKNGRAYGVPVY